MTYLLGLTGSIGMGKSTTARIFADMGHPVWDADAAVHGLYGPDGAAVDPVGRIFPDAIRDRAVDRQALKRIIAGDDTALPRLEAVVHPLVAADRRAFVAAHADAPLIVLDIPLLFESAAPPDLDGIAVVTTDAATQRRRVLARPGMTEESFAMILARQLPDADKRARADFIIPSDSLETARAAVQQIVEKVTADA
ncbi:dephospho-CoA kinase [Paracoccus sp. 1_MG-2023]|uniref:dephospho-CoA kinase n=1 Tax=unclassified Paracoccus (in: a-proteobacteria) TaxID=2688777 RepID=UPI001C089594|nr:MULTISPECIES: dephospho-CoA kinase [unclassified Paracoccus (in: a-proteobacteria)]MBU2957238.1 dephospho-CoA kinase [Paracoccus sp. C2R09]MDO6669125.1 dephospho-CoA kinase [Paracoccus sp. 1_MG-2023]